MLNESPNHSVGRSIGRNQRNNPIGLRPDPPRQQQTSGNQVANQPVQKRPCLQHRNFGWAADVRQCVPTCNFLALNPRPAIINNRPATLPTPGPVENQQIAMAVENETEENLLNLSDTE